MYVNFPRLEFREFLTPAKMCFGMMHPVSNVFTASIIGAMEAVSTSEA
jgi:hypothetical protein